MRELVVGCSQNLDTFLLLSIPVKFQKMVRNEVVDVEDVVSIMESDRDFVDPSKCEFGV